MAVNLLLYAAAVLIWGTTWYAITFQLGVVDPSVSVVYRFGLASALLFAWLGVSGGPVRLARRDLGFAGLMGLTLFCVNYWLTYHATSLIVSALVALTFSVLSPMNVVNARLFFGQPMRPVVLAGGAVGIAGVALLFLPDLMAAGWGGDAAAGLAFGLAASYSASLGNMIGARNARAGVPLVTATAWGMGLGAAAMLAWVLATGTPLGFDPRPAYVLSLAYLSVFGSIAAFLCYLSLIGRIGADRAGYSNVAVPLVAVAVSALYEDFVLTPSGIAGILLVLAGNLLVVVPDRWWRRPAAVQPAS